MAGVFDATSSTDEFTSDADLVWTHTPVGVPSLLVVHFALNRLTVPSQADEVWYGTSDTQLTRWTGSPTNAADKWVDSWYKIGGLPTGAQTVTVLHGNPISAERKVGIASTYTGGVGSPVDFTTDVGVDSDSSLTVANTIANDLIIEAITAATTGFTANSGQTEEGEVPNIIRLASYYSYGTDGSSVRSILLDAAVAHAHHAIRFPSSSGGNQVVWY
jgi:hypothetical protein